VSVCSWGCVGVCGDHVRTTLCSRRDVIFQTPRLIRAFLKSLLHMCVRVHVDGNNSFYLGKLKIIALYLGNALNK